MALGKFSARGHLALMAIALMLAACSSIHRPPRELAGHYELAGVMEMGSQLLLDERGAFEAELYYGGLYIHARGRWSVADGQVVLSVKPKPALPREVLAPYVAYTSAHSRAEESGDHYRLESSSISADATGSPIEVLWLFDDDSEQRMVWVDKEDEVLILPLREGRELKGLGIRAAGSDTRFQWLVTRPGERRFLLERVLEEEGEPRAFFHGMKLTPRGNCLLVDMGTDTGCYRRR